MDSEFKIFLDAMKLMGIQHDIHWQPPKEAWQLDLLKLGYNITSLATTEVKIGATSFLFATGGGKFLCSRYKNDEATIVTRRMGPQLFLAKNPESPGGGETMLPKERLTKEDKKNAFVTEKDIAEAERKYGKKEGVPFMRETIEPDKMDWDLIKTACKKAGFDSNKLLAYCMVGICEKNGLGKAKVRKCKDQYKVTISKEIDVK